MIDGYWKTSDGEFILISEMTTDHLRNAISWIERHKSRLSEEADSIASFAATCRGDMATYYAEQSADFAMDRYYYVIEALGIMKNELLSRMSGWGRV